MSDYLVPLLVAAALFVGFALLHRNGTKGSRGCSGCEEDCADKSECDSHNLRA